MGGLIYFVKSDGQVTSSEPELRTRQPAVLKTAPPLPKKEIPLNELRAEKLLLRVNGELISVKEGDEVAVPKDKVLILKGAQSNISRLDKDILANLKGFAPPKAKNDGNDINFPVYPTQDLWVRYSEDKKGIVYPIEATYNDKKIGKFWIRLE